MGFVDIFRRKQVQARANNPALVTAARIGDLEAASALLANGASPDSADPDDSPLYLPGSDVDLSRKTTALSAAVQWNHPQMVSLLLKAGANPNSLDKRDGNARWSPLMHAAFLGHLECARLLIASGADVNYREHNYAVITSAVSQVPVLIELLRSGADIRVTAPDIRACISGRVIPDVVAILMDLNNGRITNDIAAAKLERFA